MKVAVVGLGKIGLPLSVQIAARGHRVIGLDISSSSVATILEGRAPFPGEPGLDERISASLADGSFTATVDPWDAVRGAEVVVVVVPLVVGEDQQPDFAALDGATTAIAPHLEPGTLVSYETTLPVGTTRGRLAPALEAASTRRAGTDLFICHSPERVSSGRVFADLRRYPKLVGGVDPESGRRAVAFYASALEFDEREDLARPNGVWDLGSAEAAELAKLAETTYRDVNIAFANELALASEQIGVDVEKVVEACNSQPFSHIHQPGIWVGGHCIPVYPHLLMASVPGFRLPAVAREVNDGMALHAIDAIESALDGLSGARIAILGLAFRAGVKEDFYSGAYALVRGLQERGASAAVHDPLYSDEELQERGLRPHHLGDGCDAVVLHTAHEGYAGLRPADVPGVAVLYDGRGAVDAAAWPGVRVITLGQGT